MVVRRKRYCFCVCILPVTLCCAYLICVYSIYVRRSNHAKILHRAKDYNLAHLLQDNPAAWTSDDVKKKNSRESKVLNSPIQSALNIFIGEGEYLNGLKTDVDRTEDRKKKKGIVKLRKELRELCQNNNDKTACKDLQILEERIAKTNNLNPNLIYYSLFYQNGTEYHKDWNSYADRGLTIVGMSIY